MSNPLPVLLLRYTQSSKNINLEIIRRFYRHKYDGVHTGSLTIREGLV
jgi:hypothetical protein